MVFFQASLFPDTRKTTPELECLSNSKKRKLEEPLDDDEETFVKRSKAESTKSVSDIELHLETPLPLEWQRCLDLQSGQIHFYNTRSHTRTCMDPRRSPEPHMSLDLELNLTCDTLRKTNETDCELVNKHNLVSSMRGGLINKKIENSGALIQNLSWLAEEERQEMVATVCSRCHMLVMLIKSSPACPNCKFMHPQDQDPPKLFKQRLSRMCL